MKTQLPFGSFLLAVTIVCGVGCLLPSTVAAQPMNHGYYWTQVTSGAAWPGRICHAAVAFKNRLWVIGGLLDEYRRSGDIWSSPDGHDWTQETSALSWLSNDARGATVVFNDKPNMGVPPALPGWQ